MTAREWIESFCEQIGVEAPDEATTTQILRLASVAAHASERTAAPVACYLAGSSGRPLDELERAAGGVAGDD
jgi:Domain of unknown function (DUF6457)